MKILDLMNRPWAILDSKLESMRDVYDRHSAGEKFDVEGLKAAIASNGGNNSNSGYTVQDGVAVIPIEGVISKRMNLFSFISGGVSTQALLQSLSDAQADGSVHSIVLPIDSPGGEVDGTQVAANAIAASTKPVVAFIDGLGASAAYWLASQADQIFIADDTTWVGSIGVVTAHTDRSKADEKSGVKVTEITAGKYKRIASSRAPLNADGQQTLQDQVDHVYSVFVDDVATGLGVPVETVLSDMADGRIFIGQQAIDAGLVDGISSLDAIIAQLNTNFQQQQQNPGATRPATRIPGAKNMFRTFATEADFNAAMSAEFERGKASATTPAAELARVQAEAIATGATAERERIQAVEAQALPGHAALISTLKFDGKTTGPEAAVAVLGAERKIRGDKGIALAEDAPKPVEASTPDAKSEAAAAAAVAAASGAQAEVDPKALAAKITAHVATAAKEGRKLSVSQAAAELEAAAK